jgi:hypothetical protein
MFWRGCELGSGFFSCMNQFYPVTFWAAIMLVWVIGIVFFVFWKGGHS